MPVKEELKLEANIDHALRRHEFRFLEDLLQKEPIPQKCSKELLLKLDQLVSRVVHDHNSDGKIQILENFISKTSSLVVDPSISTFIKQEAVRKLNLMLDTIPREARKRLIFTKGMMANMSAMGKQILDAGDYDLQVAITEALCRMISEAQRGEMASQLFPMAFITTAFKEIKDSEFETDCRKFLNLMNGMLGDNQRVFTFPCISAHLDNHKLQSPPDEKLEEFWIDFNVGTQSISFYVSTNDSNESHHWAMVCMTESEVDTYNVEELNNKILLTVSLYASTTVGQMNGSQILIYFDSALNISDVARKVFGECKFKGFVKKHSVSVAKTAVHIVFDESGSQCLIPESQGSIASSKEVTVIETRDIGMRKQPPLYTPILNQQICKEFSSRNHAKLVTPSRSKVSEASINISVACGLKMDNSSASKKTPILSRGRIKPPLEMISCSSRIMAPITNIKGYTRHTKQTAALKQKCMTPDKQSIQSNEKDGKLLKGDKQMEIVPETQITVGNNPVLLPGFTEKYMGVNKKHPMSTRQKGKIIVTDDCISKEEKASVVVDKVQTPCSVLEVSKLTQNPMTRFISNPKSKAQESDPSKSAKHEKYTRTEVKEKNVKRRLCNNSSSSTETSFSKNIQKADINLPCKIPETERTKNEITDTARSKSSLCVTKRKETENNKNDKTKGKDAAKTLVNKIENKYSKEAVKRKQEDTSFKQNLKKNSIQTNKEKNKNTKTKDSRQLSMDKEEETSRDDVYSFNSKGSDEPSIELGVSSIFISKQMVNFPVSNEGASSMITSKSKKESKQKPKNPRKRLFSDTDTDKGGDDSKTDISWLRDPGSKMKSKIVGYSRQKQGKLPKGKTLLDKAADISKQVRKQKAVQHKEFYDINVSKKATYKTSKQSKCKRPRQAAGKRKNSTENSNSESEEEFKLPGKKQPPKHKKEQKNVKDPSPTKVYKIPPRKEEKTANSNKISTNVCKKPVSDCSSPGSVEQMRSEWHESDPEFSTMHPTITHSSPSLSASPPEQQTLEQSINISVDLKRVSKEWTEMSDSPALKWSRSTKKNGKNIDVGKTVQEPLSPAVSHLSQEFCDINVSKKGTKETFKQSKCRSPQQAAGKWKDSSEYSNSEYEEEFKPPGTKQPPKHQNTIGLDHSTVSGVNVLDITGHEHKKPHVQIYSNTDKTGVHLKMKTKDNTCPSFHSGSSSKRTLSCELTCVNIHESGPTLNDTISYIKRINNERSLHADISNEGSDHEIKHKKIKLRPRKLFSSPDVQVPQEHLSSVSENNATTAASDTWDRNSSDVGIMCEQISKEFARKVQNRSRKIDYFTKQSLKSAQKHLTSVDVQVRECRIMQMEKFHQTVLEEIVSFEQDSQALKQMEKEFANFWSRQTQVLNLYHKNELKRVHCLKASFETNVSPSTDNEEKIFHSEMHNMKENMKAVQDRLLKEMQEDELLSVRRGLQSLFMSSPSTF
ncbi:synaptonemal complex protein 2 isoform X2 [Ranitomeya variabilis]|uniref:synaptonemal complex protein 2 isoform X2 n=2 Tax=Ranitomeya variabilis TaxID=490064 RepID=UPI00405601E9